MDIVAETYPLATQAHEPHIDAVYQQVYVSVRQHLVITQPPDMAKNHKLQSTPTNNSSEHASQEKQLVVYDRHCEITNMH